MGIEALLLSQVITISGSTGQVVTKQADGTLALQDAASAGISGSTGATDNAILRADGTGGATLQNSALVIADNATASPNNTVNHASIQATGGTTNVSVSIVPKGTGAFTLAVPDGTTAGGNARGANAIDLQTVRTNAANVASGTGAAIVGGNGNSIASGNFSFATCSGRATGINAFAAGFRETVTSTASGQNSFAICGATASGIDAFAGGFGTVVSGSFGSFGFGDLVSVAGGRGATGLGDRCSAYRDGMFAFAAGIFASNGDAQKTMSVARVVTTNDTPSTLLTSNGTRLTVPAGKALAFTARVTGIKSDGSALAVFVRQGCIKRVGSTTSLVGSIETIGTDIEDNASTDIAITADDTNEALQINVTGIAGETWRWVAVVEGVEIAYGS